MIRVAHRGLFNGPDKQKENTIAQITEALRLSFHVELDVWAIDGKLYLGHDGPGEYVEVSFLENPKLFVHCKNEKAHQLLKDNWKVNCFVHDDEDYCITSNGYKWNNIKNWPHIFINENDRWVFVGAYSCFW